VNALRRSVERRVFFAARGRFRPWRAKTPGPRRARHSTSAGCNSFNDLLAKMAIAVVWSDARQRPNKKEAPRAGLLLTARWGRSSCREILWSRGGQCRLHCLADRH
jgi:hypothetical protein